MTNHFEMWKNQLPLLENITRKEEVFWRNDRKLSGPDCLPTGSVSATDVQQASSRLQRFAPYIERVFPETKPSKGIIESPLTPIPNMKQALEEKYGIEIPGELLLKEDNALPISGSIKARGGIYEVLKHAETIATQHELIKQDENYSQFAKKEFREVFASYKIAVGSTGNLGLSIGIISAMLGFHVTVHMSSDALQWKKDLLRSKGVTVIEYEDDYSKAVEEGRRQAASDSSCHFIDDEQSSDLFLGYAVAGVRLANQLQERGTIVDEDHPLFVYLPCGVGGGPGGVAFGLHLQFGHNVSCFFAEPTEAPCMMLGMMTQLHDQISVHDFGLTNQTAADGLAVARPSRFVGELMEPIISGCYTIADLTLFDLLKSLYDRENISLEPSALAGMTGPVQVIREKFPKATMNQATHLVWATGGGMVPENEMNAYLHQAKDA